MSSVIESRLKRKSSEILEENSAKMSKTQSNKTPIMFLQEICAKKNPKELPVYTELMEAPYDYGTTKKFFIKCQALGRESIGEGVTKKIAKHTSAELILNKFMNNQDEIPSESTCESNSISELLDYCVLKGYHKPEFQCISACGPSHSPSFTFECSLNSIKRTAEAGSKKLAKQLSAKAVLDIIKMSFPDVEKKVAVIGDSTQIKENIRQKVTSYMELKKKDKVDKMGCSLKDRHKFFLSQEDDFVECMKKILKSTDDPKVKFELLLKEIETMWTYSIETIGEVDSSSDSTEPVTNLKKFELHIDYEKFTCVLIGTEAELCDEVLEYFSEMLQVDFDEPGDFDDSQGSDISIHSL